MHAVKRTGKLHLQWNCALLKKDLLSNRPLLGTTLGTAMCRKGGFKHFAPQDSQNCLGDVYTLLLYFSAFP